MSVFEYMKVYCPICKCEMNGLEYYGKDAHCCGKECFDEWEWRKTLAIMGKKYYPRQSQPEKCERCGDYHLNACIRE